MGLQREWVTPLAAGAFLLSAVTGALMFFHLESGLNKEVHEWFSWVLLLGTALHVTVNFTGLKRHLSLRKGQILLGTFIALLAISFLGPSRPKESPFEAPMRAMIQAPLVTLAELAHLSPEQLQERLNKAGIQVTPETRSLNDVTGTDMRKQFEALEVVFAKSE